VLGFAVGHFRLWPFPLIDQGYQSAKSLLKYGRVLPENLQLEAPPGAARERLVVHRPDRLNDGFYVFVGWSDEIRTYAAWLYSSTPELLHEWPIVYKKLDADGPLNGSDAPHAVSVLNDGSLLVGFDKGDVLARIDACGDPVWTKAGVYHHSLDRAEDGGYWVWRGKETAYGPYNVLEKFDPTTGKTIRELKLVEDIINQSAASTTAFTVRADDDLRQFDGEEDDDAGDIFHPNDIEELDSNLADKFPDFEAGDLLLSFRTIHLVTVIDGDSAEIKWARYGPWRFQHDPDFTGDGKISVYNNNTDHQHSEILKIDPKTNEVSNDLLGGSFAFYTDAMGTHQYLPNGDILIVIPGEGRIVEVTGSGDPVMEFNNVSPVSPDHNMHVENGIWLPADYFEQPVACRAEGG
jgi:hypothetical protein